MRGIVPSVFTITTGTTFTAQGKAIVHRPKVHAAIAHVKKATAETPPMKNK